ncbi:unnamed protein product [Somion occarium]|uniref:Cyclic-AMP phosphodiesterase n=1 Tax=Somion occarium TaxID=3059160 RepID=A0ABP1D811_9APHY
MRSTFDLVVLGCGGGPSEYNLSGYLLKSCDTTWSQGIIALEAGSGIGALQHILRTTPSIFSATFPTAAESHPPPTAADIYSWIQCYLITHAHLDHVNSLVLSAGSQGASRREVFGLLPTLKDLQMVFSDRLWPNLASWDENDSSAALLYSTLQVDGRYKAISPHISVRTFSVSHGGHKAPYDSATFFIKHNTSGREFLFFGDVEPDSVASHPRNLEVWRAVAPKIPIVLSSIFIECSWPTGRADDMLYGHLSPEHLRDELVNLATEVMKVRRQQVTEAASSSASSDKPIRKRLKISPPSPGSLEGALKGLRVYIIHCKDDLRSTYSEPINQVIAGQVRALTDELSLGAEIISVEQGMHITI